MNGKHNYNCVTKKGRNEMNWYEIVKYVFSQENPLFIIIPSFSQFSDYFGIYTLTHSTRNEKPRLALRVIWRRI